MTTMLQCPLTHCYTAPSVKHTVNNREAFSHISEWQTFSILDKLRPTSTGPDGIPAWFLRIGAPLFAVPLSSILNLSLATSVVLRQWKQACILPIAKIAAPRRLVPPPTTDLSQLLLLLPEFSNVLSSGSIYQIYPSLRNPPPSFDFQRPVRIPTNRINHSGNCPSCPHYHCRS